MPSRRFANKLFLAVVLGSTVALGLSTFNYLQFFPAIESLQATVTRQRVSMDRSTNLVELAVDVDVSNPSSYDGFRISYVAISVDFYDENKTQLQTGTSFASKQVGSPLPAGSKTSITSILRVSKEDSPSFISFYDQNPTETIAHYQLQVRLQTFLENLASVDAFREYQLKLA